MAFTWFDVVAIAILILGTLHGGKAGFIVMVGNLASLVIGVVASAYVSTWLASTFGWSGVTIVCAFIFVTLLGAKLVRLVVWLVDKVWKVIALLPFIGMLNHLLGAVVGLTEAAVLLVVVAYIGMNFWLPNVGGIVDSTSFGIAYSVARHLTLLLPTW